MGDPLAPDTEELLARLSQGDDGARQELLARHRQRLRQMIAVRLDRRLTARVDPSDVVQETLAEADRKLGHYLKDRPLPFYPWLRRLAAERLSKLHRQHLRAGRRSASREAPGLLALSDEPALRLADRLAASGPSPSEHLAREELRGSVQEALARLSQPDREVLVLRYLEGLSTRETAAALGISEGAAKVRHLRALERLRLLLGEHFNEEQT
jgi:RNA polymerase sigma-70 factor (ECF subfamily)